MAASSAGTLQTTGLVPVLTNARQPINNNQQSSLSQQKVSYIPRIGSVNNNIININSSLSESGRNSSVNSGITSQPYQGSNVALGWKRLITNGEILYIR